MDDYLVWIALIALAWLIEAITGAKKRRKRREQRPAGEGARRPTRPVEERTRVPPAAEGPRTASAGRPAAPRRAPQRRAEPPPPSRPAPARGPLERRPEPERRPAAGEPDDLWTVVLTPPPEPRPRDREPIVAREPVTLEEPAQIVSLETLEPAGEASHRRFHERYPEVSEPEAASSRRRPLLAVNPSSLREGVMWREILGPPKALE